MPKQSTNMHLPNRQHHKNSKMEQDIFRISIIGRVGSKIDVRCDIDPEYIQEIVRVIVDQINKRGEFAKAFLVEMFKDNSSKN